LDARFSVEEADVILYSRGGAKGRRGAANADYAKALLRLIHALSEDAIPILNVWVDSTTVQSLPLNARSILSEDEGRLSPEVICGLLSSRMRNVRRDPNSNAKGGNSTKRIRIATAFDGPSENLAFRLGGVATKEDHRSTKRSTIMKSIQEIFQGEFINASSAVVQKMRRNEHNLSALHRNYTEHWPTLKEPCDLVVVAIEEQPDNEKRRQIWCGYFEDAQWTGLSEKGPLYRFLVDRFQFLGIHDYDIVPDAEFYGNGGGGGSRIKVLKTSREKHATDPKVTDTPQPEGMMVQRLVWVRKNHAKFRDPVEQHWEGKCAVTDHDCDGHPGLLIASHIYPWARSSPREKTDVNNGLLLSSPIDRLFDQGLIAFADDGKMLLSDDLAQRTKQVFGLKTGMRIACPEKITTGMKKYLAKHRCLHGFSESER
jgi:hypothetical protein